MNAHCFASKLGIDRLYLNPNDAAQHISQHRRMNQEINKGSAAEPCWLEEIFKAAVARVIKRLNRKPKDYAVAVLVFAFMFAINWFVVERYFSTPSASVTRSTSLLGSDVYHSKARDEIAVVELNDEYLEWLGSSWPASYKVYQTIFEDIAQYQPKSIFLDIALAHSRNDNGIQGLIDTMCRISASGTRIYLAGLVNEQGQLQLRPELQAHRHPAPPQRPCFEVVDVRYGQEAGTYLATAYPLINKSQIFFASTGQAGLYANAAFAMARDEWLAQCVSSKHQPADDQAAKSIYRQCLKSIAVANLPDSITLTWGMAAHEEKRYRQWPQCNTRPKFWRELMPQPLREAAPPCPFHAHVPLRMISDPHSDEEFEELHRSLNNKHVMIGAVVRGINDSVNSPIHTHIPGVYLHAMALDNLLTDYPNLKAADDGQSALPSFFLMLASFMAIVCFLIYEILHAVFKLDEEDEVSSEPAAQSDNQSFCGALKIESSHFVRWALSKFFEIALSLGLLWVVLRCLLNSYPYSVQALAQVMAVVFSLQWSGVTDKVFRSALRIFK